MKSTKTVILAAGHGTRMVSEKPKVLHEVGGKAMLDYVISASEAAGADDECVSAALRAERGAKLCIYRNCRSMWRLIFRRRWRSALWKVKLCMCVFCASC